MIIFFSKGNKINNEINLIDAAWYGFSGKVQTLLDMGVDVNAKDEFGWTALMTAVFHKHKEIANVLIKNGADVNIKNKYGNTALTLATIKGDTKIVALLNQTEKKKKLEL